MLSFFDRRKQRLEKLRVALKAADDGTLAAVLTDVGPDELAAVLGLLPVDRANRVCASIPADRLDAALALSVDGAPLGEKTVARLVTALDPRPAAASATAEPPPEGPTPMCVKALDLAGKVLGTWTLGDSAEGPERDH